MHLTKLDPDRPPPPPQVRAIAASGTHAVVIGGTQGITRAKVAALLRLLRGASVPVLIEVSHEECALPGADGYLVPLVLNAGHPDWMGARHARALAALGRWVPWERVWAEGYVVANPASAVARLCGVGRAPVPREAAGWAFLAAGLMRLPIVYLECSGRFGDMRLLRAMRAALARLARAGLPVPLLVYGGGIDSAEKARAALRWADAIVVGNAVLRPDGLERLRETVAAAESWPAVKEEGATRVSMGLRQR